MWKRAAAAGLAMLTVAGWALAQPKPAAKGDDPLPYWAFPVPSHKWPQPDPNQRVRLPGSRKSFTVAQVNDRFAAPDWYPGDHPKMPPIVAVGRKPNVFACGYCHLPNGHGRPENASLAGQPMEYIVQQVREMRAGRRRSSGTMGSVDSMLQVAKASNDAEVAIAARYFAGLKMTKWITVVETDLVPRTDIAQRNMLLVVPGRKEPIGQRIIEVPRNLERTELRDPRSGFIAYVPKGAITRGKRLVETGAGAFPCAACHGPDYRGNGVVPALAGRSPSQIVRQLYDFKHGSRGGPAADMMKPEVARMTPAMRLDIAAYLASLNPS